MNFLIHYKGVSLHRNENVILHNVDFDLSPGEFVYLTGKVGAGKSTLLKSIYADTPIFEGEAQVFEFDVAHIKHKQVPFLRRKIGIIFQDFQLLTDRSVYQNLHFVLTATGWKDKDAIHKRIEEVLEQVGMSTKHSQLPNELSGGEQQRIAIARALLNSPELILADEATGNLDIETGEDINRLLRHISTQGTAVIMSTHNLALISRHPSKTWICKNGQLLKFDANLQSPE